MDNELVDFAMQCPVNLKVKNLSESLQLDENLPGNKRAAFSRRTSDGKSILRDAMSRHVPETITAAQKQVFSAPDASWFRGESIALVDKAGTSASSAVTEALDWQVIRRAVQEHTSGTRNRRLLLWSVLNLSVVLNRPLGSQTVRV